MMKDKFVCGGIITIGTEVQGKFKDEESRIYAALEQNDGVVSCFWITETAKRAKAMDRLIRTGHLRSEGELPYPNVRYVRQTPTTCTECAGTGRGEHIGGRNWWLCKKCSGQGWFVERV